MPQNKFALARYRAIDMLLHKYRYLRTRDVVQHCHEQLGFKVSQRTIQFDIQAMRYDDFLGFYAPIEYDKQLKAYYYEDTDFSIIQIELTSREFELLRKLIVKSGEIDNPKIIKLLSKIKLYVAK